MVRKNQKGQSVVEYILLLAVLTFITSIILRSQLFKNYMGQNSVFFSELRRQMVFSYCNPMGVYASSQETCVHNYGSVLDSYQGRENGDGTRFFIPAEEYP